MARTWTPFHDISAMASFTEIVHIIQASSDYVYIGPDGDGEFYYYDGVTGSSIGFETWANAQGGDWVVGADHGKDSAWFNDKLYIAANKDPGVPNRYGVVVEYDPDTSSFSEAYAFPDSEIYFYKQAVSGNNDKIISSDADRMLLAILYQVGISDELQYYESVDGSTWTQLANLADGNTPKLMLSLNEQIRRPILAIDGTNGDATLSRVIDWENSTWADATGQDLTNVFLIGYFNGLSWFEAQDGASNWQVMKSLDFGVTLISGTSVALGFTPTSRWWRTRDLSNDGRLLWHAGTNRIYEYDNSSKSFNSVQTISDPPANPQGVLDAFYLNSTGSIVYFLTDDNVVWEGGLLGAGNAKFYEGPGVLTYKTDLPFLGVQPHGMGLSQPLGTVVAGSHTPDNQMVVYLQNDYASYTEMDTGIPTGTSVSAVEWI